MGLLPKSHDARLHELTTLATAWQIGLGYGRLNHPALNQLLGATQCWADWQMGDCLAVVAFTRDAKHIKDSAMHLEDLWLRWW